MSVGKQNEVAQRNQQQIIDTKSPQKQSMELLIKIFKFGPRKLDELGLRKVDVLELQKTGLFEYSKHLALTPRGKEVARKLVATLGINSDGEKVEDSSIDDVLEFDEEFERIKRLALVILKGRGHKVRHEYMLLTRKDIECLKNLTKYRPIDLKSIQKLHRYELVKKVIGGAYILTNIAQELVSSYEEAEELYRRVKYNKMQEKVKEKDEVKEDEGGTEKTCLRRLGKAPGKSLM